MLRQIIVTVALLTVETLVVCHWFIFPTSRALGIVALVAGSLMCLMALADVFLAIGIFRLDSSQPLARKTLEDMAKAEPMWVFATVTQIIFMGAAYVAGVYWLLVAMAIGHGAELAAFASARVRLSRPGSGLPA